VGDDGETHGSTLDFLLKQTESEHVGVCDSDFFVLHPDPWAYLLPHFQQGCQAVGVEAINKGWLKRNKNIEEFPDETRLYIPGYVAPCVFCCFFTRELALSETFVVTHIEGRMYMLETGWRMRHKIYKEKIPCHVIPGFQHSGQEETLWDSWFFGDPENVFGLHLVAGSVQLYRNPVELRESALPALLDLNNKSNKKLSKLKLKHSRQKRLL
jgi:hypothetical protein